MASKDTKPKYYIDPSAQIQPLPTSLPPSGEAGGDLSGTYPNPTVDWANGTSYYNTQYINGNIEIGTESPIQGGGIITEGVNISIDNAKADGATKGAATFNANDFSDNGSGTISIDYTNGQAASATTKGFLTAANWNTFNNKQPAGTYVNSVSGTGGQVTSTGGTNPTIGLATTPVVAGSYTNANITVDSYGRLTAAASGSSSGGVTSVTGTSPIVSSGGTTPAISINNAAADGTTKGAAAFTASDFNDNGSGVISIDYANGQTASGTQNGFLSSTDWTTFNNKQSAITPAALTKTDDTNVTLTLGGSPSTSLLQAVSLTLGWTGTLADSRIASASTWNAKVSSVSATTPLSSTGGTTPTISIADAVADGLTKGAATFKETDFNSTSGLISIDYTNGQAASVSTKGFLTATDWDTFNNKQPALGYTAEDTANKSDSYTVSSSVTYASTKAVVDGLATKQNTLTNPVTGTGTNNEIAYFNSSGSTIGSLSTAVYPNLTELSYVKGLTSPAQTQIELKLTATIYKSTSDSTAVTGTTANTLATSRLITGGTFASGNQLLVTARGVKTGTVGTCTMRIYVNTTSSLTGATLLATVGPTTAANLFFQIERNMFIKSATNTQVANTTANGAFDLTQFTSASAVNIDWTTDKYIIFALQNSNAGDSTVISGYRILEY